MTGYGLIFSVLGGLFFFFFFYLVPSCPRVINTFSSRLFPASSFLFPSSFSSVAQARLASLVYSTWLASPALPSQPASDDSLLPVSPSHPAQPALSAQLSVPGWPALPALPACTWSAYFAYLYLVGLLLSLNGFLSLPIARIHMPHLLGPWVVRRRAVQSRPSDKAMWPHHQDRQITFVIFQFLPPHLVKTLIVRFWDLVDKFILLPTAPANMCVQLQGLMASVEQFPPRRHSRMRPLQWWL